MVVSLGVEIAEALEHSELTSELIPIGSLDVSKVGALDVVLVDILWVLQRVEPDVEPLGVREEIKHANQDAWPELIKVVMQLTPSN